jgi:hypothetical protein
VTLNPKTWYPIAIVLSVLNVGGAAAAAGDPWFHAGAHAALALGFGMWAQRLRQRRDSSPLSQGERGTGGEGDRIEALEDELTRLRQELNDAQERLDFTERMLAQRPDPRHVEPRG